MPTLKEIHDYHTKPEIREGTEYENIPRTEGVGQYIQDQMVLAFGDFMCEIQRMDTKKEWQQFTVRWAVIAALSSGSVVALSQIEAPEGESEQLTESASAEE